MKRFNVVDIYQNHLHVKNYCGAYIISLMTGSSPRCPIFLPALSFDGITKWARSYINIVFFKNEIAQSKIHLLFFVVGLFL